MALSKEMYHTFELLFNELLARKENFWAILAKMDPVIHHKSEFLVPFFLGYIVHSYKQLFLILANRDMQYEEINETLEFLMRKEPKMREVLLGEWIPKNQIEYVPEMEEPIKPVKIDIERVEEPIKPVKIDIERVDTLELEIEEIKREIDLIKIVARSEIAEYEVKLAKRGEFTKSIMG